MIRSQIHKLPIPAALEVIGERLDEQDGVARQLAASMSGIERQLEKMNARIETHDNLRATINKIAISVLTAVAIGLLAFLLRISWIVQSNHVGGGG